MKKILDNLMNFLEKHIFNDNEFLKLIKEIKFH